MEQNLIIRLARLEDAPELAAIYAPYVRNTAVSYEYEPPNSEEFRRRMDGYMHAFPYLVAELDGKICGYAYAAPYGVRAAYGWSMELSVYVAQNCRKSGVGKQLYTVMEKLLKEQNVVNLYAQIAGVAVEDEYLTHDSVKFHEAMGFTLVGRMHNAGYKFGRWYDMLTLEKHIAPHLAHQPDIIPFERLDPEVLHRCGV